MHPEDKGFLTLNDYLGNKPDFHKEK